MDALGDELEGQIVGVAVGYRRCQLELSSIVGHAENFRRGVAELT